MGLIARHAETSACRRPEMCWAAPAPDGPRPLRRFSRCHSGLPDAGRGVTLADMSTLAEVEAVVRQFSTEELAELERFVRNARLRKAKGSGRSALDLPPLDLGRMLKRLGTREEWYDDMLGGRV